MQTTTHTHLDIRKHKLHKKRNPISHSLMSTYIFCSGYVGQDEPQPLQPVQSTQSDDEYENLPPSDYLTLNEMSIPQMTTYTMPSQPRARSPPSEQACFHMVNYNNCKLPDCPYNHTRENLKATSPATISTPASAHLNNVLYKTSTTSNSLTKYRSATVATVPSRSVPKPALS